MTPKQYILRQVMSEALEFAHAIDKALCFGAQNTNPSTGESNIEAIEREYIDLLGAIELAQEHGTLKFTQGKWRTIDGIQLKKDKILLHLSYVKQIGTVADAENPTRWEDISYAPADTFLIVKCKHSIVEAAFFLEDEQWKLRNGDAISGMPTHYLVNIPEYGD